MRFIRAIQRQWLFRFFSSVKLAVPLLLLIGAIVAYGTIIESRYNAEYAKLLVYGTWWFHFLIFLVGLNIFCAAISRLPYKIHHTGFVITHAGMLIILIGAFITQRWGIDGQLRVVEGRQGQSVILDNRVLEIASDETFKKINILRRTREANQKSFKRENEELAPHIKITRYLPFVDPNRAFAVSAEGLTVKFLLESPIFNQSEWLNIRSKPEIRMGPALLRLTKWKNQPQKAASSNAAHSKAKDQLHVLDNASGKVLKIFDLNEIKKNPKLMNGVQIEVKSIYTHATVEENKISNNGNSPNPAVEIILKQNSRTEREILFAKHPDFSLNKAAAFGLRLIYVKSEGAGKSSDQNSETQAGASNIIEFQYDEENNALHIELFKNGRSVLRERVEKAKPVLTPWMNMKITVEDIGQGDSAELTDLTPIEVPQKVDQLPPSALYIEPPTSSGAEASPSGNGVWIIEGQVKEAQTPDGAIEIYYGRDIFRLPFSIHLVQFNKHDYPGTQTAISFESRVKVNGSGENIVISMNEPLKIEGFTLYQSSFEMNPGSPPASIFSVNRDPGRPIKYFGSLVMALGIIIFTYMRSRFYKNKRNSK